MPVSLYHNPRCSKSREALGLLRAQGVEPQILEYLKTPPDATTLARILDLLGIEPRGLMRTQEPEYQTLGLEDPNLSREQLISAMVDHPKLIERPIAIQGDRAALGRPPENVLRVL